MALHHARRGAGEPLLLVQGVGGTTAAWGEELLEPLAQRFELVAYDHRGSGRSPAVPGPFTIGDLAGDAVALLDALDWDDAHVFGVSMGGMVAQELTLQHPERVRTLVLGATAADAGGGELTAARLLPPSIEATFRARVAPAFADEPGRLAAFRALLESAPPSPQTLLAQIDAIAGHDASARLGGVTAPTLVLHGTEDRLLAPAHGERLARLIPGAAFTPLPGAGHLFWWEQPAPTAALLTRHALGAG